MNTGTLSPFAAYVHGTAVIVGPLLLLGSSLAYFTLGGGVNHGVVGGTVGVWSCLALIIAFVGICRLMEPVAPRAAALLTVAAVFAFGGGIAFNINALHLGAFEQAFMDAELRSGDQFGILAFLPWGLFAPLTLVLTGIMLWRTRVAPNWNCVLLVLGGVLFVVGRPERLDAVAMATDVVLILALVPIGWSMLRGAPLNPDTSDNSPKKEVRRT